MRLERRSSGSTLEIAEPFQLAKQVVQRLLADQQPCGQVRRPPPLWSWVLEHGQVRGVEVRKAVLVQAIEHVLLHPFPWHTQEGADERRPKRFLVTSRGSKVA